MTKEKYLELQEDYIQHVMDYVKESGSLFPHISIFADILKPTEEQKDKPALIHIPIDNKFMENEESKDEFVNDVLPGVFESLRERFIPYGIAWAAEAWMRIPEKGFDSTKDDWKKAPIKKEIIMISIESEFGNNCFMYEIKRLGVQVNSDGELTDSVKLEKLEDLTSPDNISGRFSGLFKKLKK